MNPTNVFPGVLTVHVDGLRIIAWELALVVFLLVGVLGVQIGIFRRTR